METVKLTAAVLSLGLLAAPVAAQDSEAEPGAQGQCAPRDRIVEALGGTFNESPRGLGLSDTGNVIEVWTSTGGSWSVVVNRPDGTSCLADFGQAWALVPQGEPA